MNKKTRTYIDVFLNYFKLWDDVFDGGFQGIDALRDSQFSIWIISAFPELIKNSSF